MPKGLLEVSGTIDLAQFWPSGESDADTVKVLVSGATAFKFQPHPGAPAQVTHAFNGAVIQGRVRKPAIDKAGRITIRLQGIDAPELHYRPTVPTINGKKPTQTQKDAFKAKNGNFRQKFGETAAMALHGFLSKAGAGPIHCVVRTAVDTPGEVFDTFGRFIGDIIVKIGGVEKNANHWLCENGWAFPTFYSSMTDQEINDLIKLSDTARTKKLGIWKKASSDLTKFDPSLVFPKKGAVLDPADTTGPVIVPKLFRRSSTFGVAKMAKMVKGSFKSYLQTEPDACFTTADFLSNGATSATPRHLDEFVNPSGTFTVGPKDLVFHENASKVLGQNGKPAKW